MMMFKIKLLSFSFSPNQLIRRPRTMTSRLGRRLWQARGLATRAGSGPAAPQGNPYLSSAHLAAAEQARLNAAGPESVGPFPLPPGGNAGGPFTDAEREARIRAAGKKWKDLGRAEKVGVAWQQTTSLVVVLAGGGLALLVLYSTGTELWSEASPTKIFEDCVERVKESDEVCSIA